MSEALEWMEDELRTLRGRSQLRGLSDALTQHDGWLLKDGKRMLNLASNHYLGLEQDLTAERLAGLERMSRELGGAGAVRTGSTASRLVVGSDPVFAAFEGEFARFKGTESCLVFGSGYLANAGVIGALVGRHDLVFSDRLNHASIVDGIVLSRAEHIRYRHRDMEQLEQLLRKADPGRRKLIVTDTVFSMDGSLAPLKELVRLKRQYGAMLMVDEAHSGGVFGPHGEGLTHALGLTDDVDVQMGTFSKAYGCYGAYVAGRRLLTDYLVNKARSLIYTTALPPAVVLTIRDSWLRARQEAWRRSTLLELSGWFREQLQSRGFDTGSSECQIVPVILGDNERTVRFSRLLQEDGVAAVAIRPPTVPDGTARIRFSLMATHRREDLQGALDCMEKAGRTVGVL